MYRLLPWKKSITTLLFAVIALAIYVDDIEAFTGLNLPDHVVLRYLPLILILLITLIFASHQRWALWRLFWRICPPLNKVFPDINGIWLGSTSSNWPIIKKMLDASQLNCSINQEELNSIPLQTDALAIEIKATLFKVQVTASLSSTKGKSYSIMVCPRKDIHNRLFLTYVYNQDTPKPFATDADNHLGAVELIFEMDNLNKAEGNYWTRRNWKQGLNTAGRLEIQRKKCWRDKNKSLDDYLSE